MKILHNGIAILENDTHVSKWVQQHKRLDIARNYLSEFTKFIPEGSSVIDAGAMIGDHTITYAECVGDSGTVHAFEPYSEAYECLVHNTKAYNNVICYNTALAHKRIKLSLTVAPNAGASFTTKNSKGSTATTIDSYGISNVSFIKLDVEGFETYVLIGAKQTINEYRPVILCEVNEHALIRADTNRQELLNILKKDYNYSVSITDRRINWSDPQYDVICLPN